MVTAYSVVYPSHYNGLYNFVTGTTTSVSWDVCEPIFPEDSQNLLPLAHLNQVGAQSKLATITGERHIATTASYERRDREPSPQFRRLSELIIVRHLNFTIQCLSFNCDVV